MQPSLNLKVLSATYGVTVGVTITALPTIHTAAIRAEIQVETNDIRARFDSTSSVTTGVGGGIEYFVNTVANPVYLIDGYDRLAAMRMRCNGTTVSKINVIYLGENQGE